MHGGGSLLADPRDQVYDGGGRTAEEVCKRVFEV